jgi:hypothetical protein
MLLFFVEANQSSLLLSNTSNMNGSGFLSGGIENSVRFSKVYKGVAIKSKIACQDKAKSFAVKGLVEFDEIILVVVINNDNALVIRRTK